MKCHRSYPLRWLSTCQITGGECLKKLPRPATESQKDDGAQIFVNGYQQTPILWHRIMDVCRLYVFSGNHAARRCGTFRNCNNNFATRLKISDACHLVLGQVIRSNLLDDRAKMPSCPLQSLFRGSCNLPTQNKMSNLTVLTLLLI